MQELPDAKHRDREGGPDLTWHGGPHLEAGATEVIFNTPADPRTEDYVNDRFG